MKKIYPAAADGRLLNQIYAAMRRNAGHLHWWPGETPFEIIVGAILTQNTSWKNVEKAINNLKADRVLRADKMNRLREAELARKIRPAGYYNVKARRLKNFLSYLYERHGGSLKKMFALPGGQLRGELLAINGVGPETADSILLYAGNRPYFVVDAYTKRIFSRHGFVGANIAYDHLQAYFMDRLKPSSPYFNDYHAQIVNIGKTYCRTQHPECTKCPLEFLFKKPSRSKL
jgi:endonuclease-3 related protein